MPKYSQDDFRAMQYASDVKNTLARVDQSMIVPENTQVVNASYNFDTGEVSIDFVSKQK